MCVSGSEWEEELTIQCGDTAGGRPRAELLVLCLIEREASHHGR